MSTLRPLPSPPVGVPPSADADNLNLLLSFHDGS